MSKSSKKRTIKLLNDDMRLARIERKLAMLEVQLERIEDMVAEILAETEDRK